MLKKYVVLALETKNFLACQKSVYLYSLVKNKFIGFYKLSVISRERLIKKFPKNCQFFLRLIIPA